MAETVKGKISLTFDPRLGEYDQLRRLGVLRAKALLGFMEDLLLYRDGEPAFEGTWNDIEFAIEDGHVSDDSLNEIVAEKLALYSGMRATWLMEHKGWLEDDVPTVKLSSASESGLYYYGDSPHVRWCRFAMSLDLSYPNGDLEPWVMQRQLVEGDQGTILPADVRVSIHHEPVVPA